MKAHYSQSEENGIKAVSADALNVYSVGVSTAGAAEIRMATENAKRKIVASTIDGNGARIIEKYINEHGCTNQIAVKLEDVSGKLPYPNNFFDYIYARLVLHYLPKSGLESALANLHRILKSSGKIFIAVRSIKSQNATEKTSVYDDKTGMTTYLSKSDPSVKKQRFFHTPDSISGYVIAAGFQVDYVSEYKEIIYSDFERKGRPSEEPLIELLATKP